MNHLINALHLAVSACLSATLVYMINMSLGGPKGEDFLNSWALMHGSFLIVLPFFALFIWIFYILLRPVALRMKATYSPEKMPHFRPLSAHAVLSLLSALIGLSFIPPVLFSLAGVILGHMARRRCRDQPELGGSAIALSGIIIGYLGGAFGFYIIGMLIYSVWFLDS